MFFRWGCVIINTKDLNRAYNVHLRAANLGETLEIYLFFLDIDLKLDAQIGSVV